MFRIDILLLILVFSTDSDAGDIGDIDNTIINRLVILMFSIDNVLVILVLSIDIVFSADIVVGDLVFSIDIDAGDIGGRRVRPPTESS